jgi:hypothetical protein
MCGATELAASGVPFFLLAPPSDFEFEIVSHRFSTTDVVSDNGSGTETVLTGPILMLMPPLPTLFDDATNASIASIQRRQNDLRDFQVPRLRSCTESLATQQQYAAELREDLETITRLVEVGIYTTLFFYLCVTGASRPWTKISTFSAVRVVGKTSAV